MSQPPEGQFRGRIETQHPWSWGQVAEDRPHVPWFGVFLLLFGGLLLIEQLVPDARGAGSAVVVAVGIGLVVAWVVNRNIWELYAGAVLTAVSLPSLLQDLNVISTGQGWGTLFLGIAFLGIAVIRAASGGGIGWQLLLGGLLAIVGGNQVAEREIANFPSLGQFVWPAIILIVGILLVARGLTSGRRNTPPSAPR
jgi:hypothetical protein